MDQLHFRFQIIKNHLILALIIIELHDCIWFTHLQWYSWSCPDQNQYRYSPTSSRPSVSRMFHRLGMTDHCTCHNRTLQLRRHMKRVRSQDVVTVSLVRTFLLQSGWLKGRFSQFVSTSSFIIQLFYSWCGCLGYCFLPDTKNGVTFYLFQRKLPAETFL